MKHYFSIRKSEINEMVDNGIRSILREMVQGDLSKEFANWALNVADRQAYPVNAAQAMWEWYNGDESALDVACSRFAEYMGIDNDESVMAAARKAANEFCYYNNFEDGEQVELSEAQLKRVVKECAKRILRESCEEDYAEFKDMFDGLTYKQAMDKIDELGLTTGAYNGNEEDGMVDVNYKSILGTIRDRVEVLPNYEEYGDGGMFQGSQSLMEGIYGYPDTVDKIILMFENDRDCMSMYGEMAKSLARKANKGVQLDAATLANSSWMKQFQQMCFRRFAGEQPDLNRTSSPALFRNYVADKMLDAIENGQF